MADMITQREVLDYIMEHPGVNPLMIADDFEVPLSNVKAKLMKLLDKRRVVRRLHRSSLDQMFYYPNTGQYTTTRSI